jgi:hypothetical protein
MTDPTVTPEMYQFFLATNAANATQWTMANGSTIIWSNEPTPEPIDPDLLMDEGL